MMSQTYAQWIDAQIAAPASSHLQHATVQSQANPVVDPELPSDLVNREHRMDAWWQIVLKNDDQLRQRVAFALSQILVISDRNDTIGNFQGETACYYDLLAKHAFGNYRTLLEEVTLNPLMGVYLSHLQNAKANPQTGAVPDENYAREIMQLFSIGLVELHPDGTIKLDGNGLPIPTYDQMVITETAKVFTGWGFADPDASEDEFYLAEEAFSKPMRPYPTFHDSGPKVIVTGRALPAGQGAVADVRDTLDTLVNHPNTGPFLVRRLIQRLVTSNPSPGYVYRVAQAFEDNGAGQRGDLGAVVKAILLDHEARSSETAAQPNFGKLKEPRLRVSAMLRALNVQIPNGRLQYNYADEEIDQAPLAARTVFNFFRPNYVPVGDLAASGLVAPEMQITTDTTAIGVPNRLSVYAFSTLMDAEERAEEGVPLMDLSNLLPLWTQPEKIIDELNLLFCAGSLSRDSRARILPAMTEMPPWVDALGTVSSLIYLVATSPDAAVQN